MLPTRLRVSRSSTSSWPCSFSSRPRSISSVRIDTKRRRAITGSLGSTSTLPTGREVTRLARCALRFLDARLCRNRSPSDMSQRLRLPSSLRVHRPPKIPLGSNIRITADRPSPSKPGLPFHRRSFPVRDEKPAFQDPGLTTLERVCYEATPPIWICFNRHACGRGMGCGTGGFEQARCLGKAG